MIFYFSGTGNSYYAAKKLADRLQCETVDMAKCRKEANEIHLKDGEPVGFVFPVYYFTMPDVVYDFVSKLSITGQGYTFAVITCGGSIGSSGKMLKSELEKRNVSLDNVFSLKMPDNAIFYYAIKDKTDDDIINEESESKIREICDKVAACEKADISGASGKLFRGIYHMMASTKKFYADDKCTGCGKCEANCPDSAINIQDGKPVWIKSGCTMCTACINRCPERAIQYGKKTASRNRYEHPVFTEEKKF